MVKKAMSKKFRNTHEGALKKRVKTKKTRLAGRSTSVRARGRRRTRALV